MLLLTTQWVALTRVDQDLRREIRVWKTLWHRNIHFMCGFYEGIGSTPALVSPWYANGDITDYVRRHANDPDVDTLKLTLVRFSRRMELSDTEASQLGEVLSGLTFCA